MRPASFPLPPLLRATIFRMALSYLGIFTVSAIALLALVSWTTSVFIEWQIQETVEAETTGLSEQYRERGITGMAEVIGSRASQDLERRAVYLLSSPDGTRLAGNLFGWPTESVAEGGWMRFPIERFGEGRFGTDILARLYILPDGHKLLVGRSLHEARRVKSAINRALGWGLALTILLGIVGGYLTSRHMLQRVDSMSRTARRIVGGDMASRMKLSGARDEFDQLAASFNDMMDEIERLVDNIRTVTDNIAHDLRTPLNRLRSRIDVALLAEPDAAALRRTLEETLAEADNLLATFNALLAISNAESGQRLHSFEPLDPARLAEDVVELYEPLAEDKGISLSCHADIGLQLDGDRHLLFQALANLVDNAVKYTPAQGRVAVTVAGLDQAIEIAVTDSGPGIPKEACGRVLDRFVRLDQTRSTPGNGLGLSLVRAVAHLHGAALNLDDNGPGLKVRMTFPLPPA
ncbi:sensor histidine kinase [Magnetospirillum moscoviense]|uniref:histidine kinase n=1 Tax=Magnetospirillum moscoviense TaxID=1437059 RepID=A0A178MT31_9PROT|nr:HAMP domain-containing sensor histidine kinase [Magnetospirillum moscoviense]MBF0324942.1 HAMP domain-containing histidine kinase [Alphaproteobacteria bacterium]OAN52432.1 two-component sensor histidine kinase [Magnetospirillum moscoviense]